MVYVVQIVIVICYILIAAMIIRSIMSWFPLDPNNIFVKMVHTITEPILAPFRRIIPRLEMIDFTPMVAIILLYVIVWALQRTI